MRLFTKLFIALDQTTKTTVKVAALAAYFAEAPSKDRLWTIALLSHRRPRRTVNTTLLRQWSAAEANLPLWLFEESYHVVGDLAETIARVLPPPTAESDEPLSYWIDYIRNLKDLEEDEKHELVLEAWRQLNYNERFIFNKLITGGWRIGVSQKLMVRGLSKATEIEEASLAHRIMGNWSPDDTTFEKLILTPDENEDASRPYPFYLAYPLEAEPATLGQVSDWQAEYKWDGIRGQLLVRQGEWHLWSRGEELITDKFPELEAIAQVVPDGTVLDGEIIPFKDGAILPFNDLQTRIGRKKVGKTLLAKVPCVLRAYDLLEWQGTDLRDRTMSERRQLLETLFMDLPEGSPLQLSETIDTSSWEYLMECRADARKIGAEGLMLKRKNSPYQVGRKRGDWWKWKVDPLTVDAVMLYAQRGHGRRANLYTDFTFAAWDGDKLVPFTKAYSGLTDAEFKEITNWVQRNTIERFGPVRSVKPVQVFELAFEGIQESSRHKSGIALRFPRILRWRKDKPVEEAATLEELKRMLDAFY